MYSPDATLGIIGIPSIISIARGAAGAFAAGGDRDPNRLCPGSPPIVPALAAAFASQLGLASEIRSDVVLRFAGEKDLEVVQGALSDPGMLAQAAVWLAWGGADCKTGTKEPPLQRRLQEIARSAAALRTPPGASGLPFSPSIAGIVPAGGATTALLLGGVVLAALLFSGGRRKARR